MTLSLSRVRKLVEEELRLPYLKITTDYSPIRLSAHFSASRGAPGDDPRPVVINQAIYLNKRSRLCKSPHKFAWQMSKRFIPGQKGGCGNS